jgi:hypothetical protein
VISFRAVVNNMFKPKGAVKLRLLCLLMFKTRHGHR